MRRGEDRGGVVGDRGAAALADKNGWVFGELLEHALDALEKSATT
jgi:hypothetical protein